MLLVKHTRSKAAEGVDSVQGTPEPSLQLPRQPMVRCFKGLILLETKLAKNGIAFHLDPNLSHLPGTVQGKGLEGGHGCLGNCLGSCKDRW